jgi:beta-glucosidase
MCANGKYLNDKLRGEWQFEGYVVTDCNAFDAIHTDHHFTPSLEATINVSYGAGSDLYNCGALRSKQLEGFMSESAANEALLTESLREFARPQSWSIVKPTTDP